MKSNLKTFKCFGASELRLHGHIKKTRPLNANAIICIDTANNKIIRLNPLKGSVKEPSHA